MKIVADVTQALDLSVPGLELAKVTVV